jgi:sorbitol-specific phosphotransferase system component IIC
MSSLGHVECGVVMSPDKVVQELRLLRYDRRPSIRSVAIEAGISRRTIYNVLATGHLSQPMAEALGRVLQGAKKPAYQNPRSAASRTRL